MQSRILRTRFFKLVAAATALTSLAAHAAELPNEPDCFLPNVILITIDTLRADHLSCYGYDRPTSPRIDAFGKRATFYTRCVASSPWTLPTHASLFTGKYSFEHGARTFKLESGETIESPLADEHLTLAEAFKAEGYQTGAFVANSALLRPYWRLDQGFDTYMVKRLYADRLNPRVFEWLEAHYTQPFFLFINYMDVHSPYNTNPRPGVIDGPLEPYGFIVIHLYWPVMGKREIPQPRTQKVINQYDTAIANVDEHVGLLLDWLVEKGVYDNTMVVLTSDHGEHITEHYLVEHGKDVYEEAVWVPLIIKVPGQRTGRVIDKLVSSIDVPELILSEFPPDIAERYEDAFSLGSSNHPVITENYYTRMRELSNERWGKRFDRVRTAVYDWPYKFIRSSDGQHELYNLDKDPKELTNLFEEEPETAARLTQALEQLEALRPRAGPTTTAMPELTEEERNELKALGYL